MLLASGCLCGGMAAAQSVAPPPACAGKSGDALRDCVRDAAPVEMVQRLEPVSGGGEAAQLVDCVKTYAADRPFCLARNRIVLECHRHARYPSFDACFQHYIANVPVPGDESCTGKDPVRRACARRNAVHVQCRADPLRYFTCLGQAPQP